MPLRQGPAEQGKLLPLCSALGRLHLETVSSLGLPPTQEGCSGGSVWGFWASQGQGRRVWEESGELGQLDMVKRWLGAYLMTGTAM